MRMLVCVDDSTFSDAAVAFVAGLPGVQQMDVVVLSVAPDSVVLSTVSYTMEMGHNANIMQAEMRVHRRIADRAEIALRNAGIRAESRVVCGDPRSEIVDMAVALEADLIIVGSHGRTGVSRLLMGSVAASVASHAPCSVLVVRKRGT